MSCSLNSSKGAYVGDEIGDYHRLSRRILGFETMAHIVVSQN